MKNHIAAIDNAIENNTRASWQELNFNSTFGAAYLYSLEAGNDLPNYDDVIWDTDIAEIITDCHRTGITEFTISSTFSGLINTIAQFQKCGCTLQGIVEINSKLSKDWRTGEKKRISAFLIKVC
jgi:hypothetical protein